MLLSLFYRLPKILPRTNQNQYTRYEIVAGSHFLLSQNRLCWANVCADTTQTGPWSQFVMKCNQRVHLYHSKYKYNNPLNKAETECFRYNGLSYPPCSFVPEGQIQLCAHAWICAVSHFIGDFCLEGSALQLRGYTLVRVQYTIPCVHFMQRGTYSRVFRGIAQ